MEDISEEYNRMEDSNEEDAVKSTVEWRTALRRTVEWRTAARSSTSINIPRSSIPCRCSWSRISWSLLGCWRRQRLFW